MANGHKEENVPQHHVRAGCHSRFKPSKYRNMFQIQKWHIHLLLSLARLIASLFIRSLSPREVPFMVSVPDKKTQLSPTSLDAHFFVFFALLWNFARTFIFQNSKCHYCFDTNFWAIKTYRNVRFVSALAHSQPRLDAHQLRWRSALITRANYIKVEAKNKEQEEKLSEVSSQRIIIYLDVKCENSHFAKNETEKKTNRQDEEQMMWFGGFVAHFSSGN